MLLLLNRCRVKTVTYIFQSLLSLKASKSENASPNQQSVWLLELMSHTKNVGAGVVKLPENTNTDEVP